MVIEVILERYTNPYEFGGQGWMAHSDSIHAIGVFGFGATEQAVVDDFGKELEKFREEA